MRTRVIQEQLVVPVHRERALVDQEDDQTNRENSEDHCHDCQRHNPPPQISAIDGPTVQHAILISIDHSAGRRRAVSSKILMCKGVPAALGPNGVLDITEVLSIDADEDVPTLDCTRFGTRKKKRPSLKSLERKFEQPSPRPLTIYRTLFPRTGNCQFLQGKRRSVLT